MERVYILGNMYPEPAAPFSLSLSLCDSCSSYALFCFFFFTNRCEATIMLIFSKVRRYSTHKHTSSHYGFYKGWVRRVRREPFPRLLSSSMPLNEWPCCASVTKRHVSAPGDKDLLRPFISQSKGAANYNFNSWNLYKC